MKHPEIKQVQVEQSQTEQLKAERSVDLVVTGLPGSGKSRVIQSMSRTVDGVTMPGCFESSDLMLLADLAESGEIVWPYQTLCVIDVRTPLVVGPDDWLAEWLQQMLLNADGIVFTFLEGASLNDQAWWSKWVGLHASHLPIVRWLNQRFPDHWQGFPLKEVASSFTNNKLTTARNPLQTFEFNVGRISWDHLLFGLDSSKQNLGMKIVRVKGVVQTLEYENRVAIEGTATRWELFAADEATLLPEEVGRIQIQGMNLNQVWLAELIQASLA